MIDGPLTLGAIIFPGIDQIDFTGPFEILSRLPDSTFHVIWKDAKPVRDANGLILTPDTVMATAPQLDVLIVPGGPGQQDLMEDAEIISFIQRQAAGAKYVMGVCTGVLVVGLAGLLRGRRATTYWATFDMLESFGAIPVDHRVVVDGPLVTAAGVTSGLDGALRLAALLRGDVEAQKIQLLTQYAPEPPFNSGSPVTAPPEVLQAVQERTRQLTEARRETVRRLTGR